MILERIDYGPTYTRGYLQTSKGIYATIERPWIDNGFGGQPFESCVPEGDYFLTPHRRPTGDDVVALINPQLGVFYKKYDRPEAKGRYLILLHAGNWAKDVVGCIAPGQRYDDTPMVFSSRNAMKEIMATNPKTLTIRS